MDQLYKLSVRDLAAGVRDGRWSAADAVRSTLHRIERVDPRVDAWAYLDREAALAHAQTVAVEGAAAADLCGVPVAIKDIIDVAGMPTRYGSVIFASAGAASRSAECVTALERAGAIALGKSVTTEFAYYTPGKTRNPWNATHTPGGSSMGSAASVACGMAAAALGTQTNGSVIRPAAFCGVVGFKPSIGTISNDGTLDPWPTLDHTGVFARNVGDAALVASVIATGRQLPKTIPALGDAPRLALVRSPVWHLAQDAQKTMLEANARTLAGAGAQVEVLELPDAFDRAHRVHRSILAYEGFRHFRDLQERHRSQMSAPFNQLLDEGAAMAEADYLAALDATRLLRLSFENVLEGYDALITPPAAGEAPATLAQTGDPSFCTIWTLLGAPAITIPVGRGPAGLPLGLQIVGGVGANERVVAAAAWCESLLSVGREWIFE